MLDGSDDVVVIFYVLDSFKGCHSMQTRALALLPPSVFPPSVQGPSLFPLRVLRFLGLTVLGLAAEGRFFSLSFVLAFVNDSFAK